MHLESRVRSVSPGRQRDNIEEKKRLGKGGQQPRRVGSKGSNKSDGKKPAGQVKLKPGWSRLPTTLDPCSNYNSMLGDWEKRKKKKKKKKKAEPKERNSLSKQVILQLRCDITSRLKRPPSFRVLIPYLSGYRRQQNHGQHGKDGNTGRARLPCFFSPSSSLA